MRKNNPQDFHFCPPTGLCGVTTHQFLKAYEQNVPEPVAWEDLHQAQTLEHCRALMQNLSLT